MRLLLALLGVFIMISLAALACADLDNDGGDDVGSAFHATSIVSQ